MLKKITITLLQAIIFLMVSVYAKGQGVYPVQVTPQLIPPYSVYLSDYATAGNEKLRVIVLQRDLSNPSYQIRLVMTVEWNNRVIMRTSRSFNPPPINLNPGIPMIISGAEIAPYLDSRNIDFVGYDRTQYERTRALPEGQYRISFTAFHYQRQDAQLSAEGNSFYYLAKSEPPLINYPACGTKLTMKTPQQIIFSWMPRNTASPNSALDTEYEFSLYETRPAGRNPNDVVLTSQPVFRTRTNLTQLIYGPAEPMLLKDMTYVWRVQAIDRNGRDAFRNNGYSEVCTFYYSDALVNFDIGTVKDLQARGETKNRAKISWTAGTYDSYRIQYKKTGQGYEWFESNTKNAELKIFDLEPDTEYEARVQAKKSGYFGPYSDIVKFRTLPNRPAQCGENPFLPDLNNPGNPLQDVTLGTVVNARGVDMTIIEATPLEIPGWFKGIGHVTFDYFLGLAYGVKFDRIYINDNRDVIFGRIDVLSEGMDALIQQQIEANTITETTTKDDPRWQDTEFHEEVFEYDVAIAAVTFDINGDVVIIDEAGNKITEPNIVPILVNAPDKAVIVEDKNGDQYVVQKDQSSGKVKVTKVVGGGLSPGMGNTQSVVTSAVKEKIIVLILEQFEDEINAWLRINGKGGEEDEDITLALLLPECFDQDAEILKSVRDTKIQYFKSHPPELQEKVESSVAAKELFDGFEKLFGKVENVDWNRIDEDGQLAARDHVCRAIKESGAVLIDIPSERTYLTPAGTPIKLPANHKVNSICGYEGLYPDGALTNFTVNGKTYVAKLETQGPPRFYGYYEFANKQFGSYYADPNEYKVGKTDVVFIQKTFDGQKSYGKLYLGEYVLSDIRTNQQIVQASGVVIRMDAISLPEQKASTRSFDVSFDCPISPLEDYLSLKDNELQKWLKNAGLKADVFISNCLEGTTTHVSNGTTTRESSGDAKGKFDRASFNSDIGIWACWDGKQWKVEHKYKSGALNPTHPKIAKDLQAIEKEIDKRVDKLIEQANNGQGGTNNSIVHDYGEDGQIYREGMNFLQAIIAVKDFGKELVNYAKIPEQTWNSKGKPNEYDGYPVHVPPMLAGAGDRTLEELRGSAEFVVFALDIATDPSIAKETWNSIKDLKLEDVKKLVQSSAVNKIEKYAQGGVVARHEAGADVVTVVVTVTAAYKLLTNAKDLVANSGEKAKQMVADILPRIKKITSKPFKKNPNHSFDEFARQLKDQEVGLNELTVDDFLKNRDGYIKNGRSHAGSKAQKEFREKALQDRIEENIEKGMSPKDATKEANEWISDKAALHNPDQIAGGHADQISGLGASDVNSSIGSQWKDRITEIDNQIRDAANAMTDAEKKATYLNIELTIEM